MRNKKTAVSKYNGTKSRNQRESREDLVEIIRKLRIAKKYSDARIQVERSLDRYPDDPEFIIELGWIEFENAQNSEDLSSKSDGKHVLRRNETLSLYEKAANYFDWALKFRQDDEGALQGKIASLRKLQKFPEANSAIETAKDLCPDSIGIICEEGWYSIEQRDYNRAKNAFEKVLKTVQTDDSIYLWQSYILRNLGNFDAAITLLGRATEEFPDSVRLEAEKGWVYFHSRNFKKAIEQFNGVLKKEPNLETALQGRVASLRLSGALGDAQHELDRLAAEIRSSPGLTSEAGWIAFAQKDFERAEQAFRSNAERLPKGAIDNINLAWVLAKKGGEDALSEAENICLDVLGAKNSAEAAGCLGVVAFKQGRFFDAERYLRKSIELDPDRGHYADLISLYTFLARFEDALIILSQGMTKNPGEPGLNIEAAVLYTRVGRLNEAVAAFRRSVALEPDNVDALTGLALVLQTEGHEVEAEVVLRDGIQRIARPKTAALHLALARLLAQQSTDSDDQHLLDEALEEVLIAQRVASATAESYFDEGVIRFKLKQYKQALNAFDRSREMDPKPIQADVNANRVRLFLKSQRDEGLELRLAGVLVAVVALVQLGLLWYLRINYGGGENAIVSNSMITVLVPISMVLMIVAFVLPSLAKLSMTGIEVELAKPSGVVESAGPKGYIEFPDAMIHLGSRMSL